MKFKNVLKKTAITAAMMIGGVFLLGAYGQLGTCFGDEPPAPDTTCELNGGYCDYFENTCKENYIDWISWDCPQGRSGKCCIPEENCTDPILSKKCTSDQDCACGTNRLTGQCDFGTAYCIGPSQCPDFCSGIGGNLIVVCDTEKGQCVQKSQ